MIDPAAGAAALSAAAQFPDYMVYEQSDVWYYAGGCRAAVTVDAHSVRVRRDGHDTLRPWRTRPLATLGEVLHGLDLPEWTAYGWLSFEAARRDPDPGDLAYLIVPEVEVRLSRTSVEIRGANTALTERITTALADVTDAAAEHPAPVDISRGRARYQHGVAEVVAEIARGAFQKVVLARRVPVEVDVDFPATYLLGRRANTPARSFLFDLGGRRATGFCPETVLEAHADGTVCTQPLAGTRAFGTDSDSALRAELLSDPKEIYEHAVSVKLAYDELTQVCAPGSVVVSDLMSVKERGTVQHLGSRVRGTLGTDRSAWDALQVVFPAITASGVPKSVATDYIARSEPCPRGLYAGGVLRASSDGSLDVGLVLRSVFAENGRQWLCAGAGIVAGSTPAREYEETCEKLRSVAAFVIERSDRS